MPQLEVHEAIDWLDGSGARFVFFENTRTGRGNVLYRRHDGNFGVITPAGGEVAADHEDLTLGADL